jgi:hypothetical protein
MPRRPALLLTLLVSLILVACQGAPAAPPLTDPKEILVKSATALQDVKTFEIRGTFGGSVNAGQMGDFDLSKITLTLSADVAGKKAHLVVDAPTLLGTNLDLIALPEDVYVKLTGPFGAFVGLDGSGKYTKLPADSSEVPDEAKDPAKAIEEMRKSIDELPSAPEKLADEKCGDQDCYHVRVALTAAQLRSLSPEAGDQVGDVSFDVWTRKNDLRPARFAFSVDAGTQGTVTGTFDITYDGSVSIEAPPADQVVPAAS